ncbi:MAG: hypothetical protein ABTS16_13860 [Candidatus Accumulibacter phosphatis]|jgi:hypothetical protein
MTPVDRQGAFFVATGPGSGLELPAKKWTARWRRDTKNLIFNRAKMWIVKINRMSVAIE